MQKNIFIQDLKLFAIILFATGAFIILFSFVGHILTPTQLIPSSFIGGIIGLLVASYFSLKQNIIKQTNVFPVFLSSLFIFGLISFFIVFNFNKPMLIFGSFLLVGIAPVIAKHFFSKHYTYSTNKFYGLIGVLFIFPTLYFLIASFLKFQAGQSFLFAPIDSLLKQSHGQENFNAITPFLFGGGLLLAFILNLITQLDLKKDNKNIFDKTNLFNLIVLLITCLTGLTLMIYLVIENSIG